MSSISAPPKVEIVVGSITKTTRIVSWVRKEDGMIRFFTGDEIEIAYNISVDDTYTDPTVVTVTVLDPGGTKTAFVLADSELTKLDTGKYLFTYTLALEGEYIIAWSGTAPAIGIHESRVYTKTSRALA